MKRKMNICLLSLAILIICTFTTSVFAVVAETLSATVTVDNGILLKAIDPLIQENSMYYEISKTEINDVESVNKDGVVSTTFNATLTMCLKFQSVSDIPFMKGMLNELGFSSIEQCTVDAVTDRINSPDFKASGLGKIASTSYVTEASSNQKDNLLLANCIINEINSTKNSLKEYIGIASDFDYSFLVTTLPDGTIVNVKIQNFDEYIPIEEFYPESEIEMMNSGSELLTANVTNANAGGIIINKNSSGIRYHVNMIVFNDTVTRKYAAHNSDHINKTYTSGYWGSGETQEYYVFNNYTPD